jgi:hypothetical protein
VVVTPSTTRENLYVAMTRGRRANRADVALDRPDDAHSAPLPSDLPEPTAQDVLARVLANSGAEPSAHQAAADEAEAGGNTTQLGAELEALTAAALHDRWAALIRAGLPDQGQADLVLASEAFGALSAELHRSLAQGWDPEAEFQRLAAARPLGGAADPAAVLHARLAAVLDHHEAQPGRPVRQPSFLLGMFPRVDAPASPAMAHAIEEREQALIERAAELLRRALANREPWLAALGPRLADPLGADRWDEAALAVAAYRDRYQVTGPEPLGRPDSVAQRRDANRIAGMSRGSAPEVTAPNAAPAASVPAPPRL